jgi:hypothetical protein
MWDCEACQSETKVQKKAAPYVAELVPLASLPSITSSLTQLTFVHGHDRSPSMLHIPPYLVSRPS